MSARGVLLPGFTGLTLPEWLEKRLVDGLAGVCLFGSNISSPGQLRELTAAITQARPTAIIALDEEAGDVTRLFYDRGSPYPGNAWLGRLDDLAETERIAALVGGLLHAHGCNLNLAPCVDINSNPRNPVIGVRSFGVEPGHVAAHAAAWVRGQQSAGVAVSAKHFPGHGDTDADSHRALPVVDQSLDVLLARELVPFRAAVDAGAWTVMTSHVLLPQLDHSQPATFSPIALKTLLRDRLGFTGVVVSDALDMAGASGDLGIPEAAVRALAGGCDLLCLGPDTADEQAAEIEAHVQAAVDTGWLPADRLSDATARVAALGRRLLDSPPAQRHPEVEPLPWQRFPEPDLDPAWGCSVFDVSPRARSTLAARPTGHRWTLVRLDTPANVAAGTVPWGPFAALDEDPARLDSRFVVVTAGPDATIAELLTARAEGPLLLVGRDNHQHGWVRRLADEARAASDDVLVADMGWPEAERRYADIATFGASRFLGASLLHVLLSASAAEAGEGPS